MNEEYYRVNETDIYFLRNNHLHSFCIGAYIHAGIMYETERDNGISHLYEHMVFRNLKQHYDRDIYELMSENGIFLDACTYKEFVYFSIYGIPKGFSLALDILSKMFLPLDIPKEEFAAEKSRIRAEIRENDDKNTIESFHNNIFWDGTPLARTNTGNWTTINRITQKKLNKFRNMMISDSNIFYYITGNVCETDKKRLINVVSSLPVSEVKLNRDNIAVVPSEFTKRSGQICIKPSSYTYVSLSFDIDNTDCPMAVRDLIYSVLFVNDDSVINQSLSESRAAAYSYNCYLEQYKNISRFCLIYEVDIKNLYKSLEAVICAFEDVKNGKLNFKVNYQKQITNWYMMQDNPTDLSWSLAYENHILGENHCDFSKPALGRYDAIVEYDITEAAKKIFVGNNLVLSLKGDKKHIDLEIIKQIIKQIY